MLVLPPGSVPAQVVDAKLLRDMSMVASLAGSDTRAWVDEALQELGAQVRIVAECNDHLGRLELVAAGVGATISTREAAASYRAAELPTCPWPDPRPLALSIVRRDSDGPPATVEFAKALGHVVMNR